MCSLTEPLEEGEVGWLRRMRPPVLDPAVGSEKCWQRLEGGYAAEFSLHAGARYLKQRDGAVGPGTGRGG